MDRYPDKFTTCLNIHWWEYYYEQNKSTEHISASDRWDQMVYVRDNRFKGNDEMILIPYNCYEVDGIFTHNNKKYIGSFKRVRKCKICSLKQELYEDSKRFKRWYDDKYYDQLYINSNPYKFCSWRKIELSPADIRDQKLNDILN